MSRLTPPNSRAASALRLAVNAALGDSLPDGLPRTAPAQPGATPRNTAQHVSARACKTNPPAAGAPAPLNPNQLSAARLLLEGRAVNAVAAALGVHPYTVSRWKRDPRFQAELRRQVEGATRRNGAQHGATFATPRAQNEPTGKARS